MAMRGSTKNYKRAGYYITGAPQLVFTTRSGKQFTKTFSTDFMANRAYQGWVRKGGPRPMAKRLTKKRRYSKKRY